MLGVALRVPDRCVRGGEVERGGRKEVREQPAGGGAPWHLWARSATLGGRHIALPGPRRRLSGGGGEPPLTF